MKATQNPPTAEVSPAVILRGAALYISRHGWSQGTYYADNTAPDGMSVQSNPTPPACAMGAIAIAAFGRRLPEDSFLLPEWVDYKNAEDALLAHLDLLYPPTGDDDFPHPEIGEWNDQPDRTAEQVIDTLTAAANEWDNAHDRQAVPA